MRILISNDDGIYSPGILALAEASARFGDVRIVAPDVEQSSAGHSITAWRPLNYKRTPIKGFEAFRVNGTPADCVVLGAHNWEKVDVVLSGINFGTNSASNTLIRDCYLHDVPIDPNGNADGIQFREGCFGATIRNNVLHDIGGSQRAGISLFYPANTPQPPERWIC